jgi:L-alanine-DL-glutamate epimerase-like enolase superfamily enzyme
MMVTWKRAAAKLLNFHLERAVGGSGVRMVDVIIVEVEDSEGMTGLGFSYVLGGNGGLAAQAADYLLRTFVVGHAVVPPRALWKKISKSFNRSGHGPNMIGLAAIDTACWDLEARRRSLPLGVAMGGQLRPVPVYASGDYSSGQSPKEAADVTLVHLSRGFRAVKPRVGGVASDAGIISAVRDAVGGDVDIMVDANEKCDIVSAVRLLSVAEDFGLTFVEEPLPAQAFAGLRLLKKSSRVPLAIGEHFQDVSCLVDLMAEGVANVVQPDLAMIGGLTPTLDLALVAEAFDLVVSPHFLPGLFMHIAAASSSVRWLEDFPLLEPLFDGWPTISGGEVVAMADEAGHGLALSGFARSLLENQR